MRMPISFATPIGKPLTPMLMPPENNRQFLSHAMLADARDISARAWHTFWGDIFDGISRF